MTTVQQDFQAIVGNWETPADWITGAVPTSSQDAAIGAFGESSALIANSVTPNNVITVNSIVVNRGSALTIGDDDTLIAINGTVTSQSDTDVFVSGNLGVINVEAGGVLEFGAYFYNAGTLNVQESAGLIVNDAAILDNTGTINLLNGLTIDDSLTVWGKGLINLGANLDNAAIVGLGGSAFTNVDDTISGQAVFLIRSFDNEAGGTIVAGAAYASGQADDYLTIDSATISNAGAIDVVANSELFLNSTWGVSGSLINTGQIDVASQSVLAIGADFTVSGAGVIALDGAGAFIDSDLLTASWTLTNDSTIEGLSSQTELGQNGANEGFLTLVNQGSIIADLSGNELTVSTGANVIQDAGGLFEAENGALLVIDSAVRTGQDVLPGSAPPPRSTIEAASGGTVDINAAILDGVSLGFGNQLNGQILLDGGTVNVAAGVSLGVPVTFVGAGGRLNLTNTPVDVDVNGAGGAISLSGARADVTGGGFTVTESGTDSLAIGGNGVGGAADVVHGSHETITTHASSHVAIVGSHDTVDVGVANALSLEGANDVLDLQQLFGHTTLSDFGATDVMEISKADFADFQALLSHTTQSGANSLITLDSHDTIELTNVARTSLTASEFKFV